MGDVAAVRAGLRERLRTIPDLEVGGSVLDAIDPPVAVIGEVKVVFDRKFRRALDELVATVRLYASRADVEEGEERLDGYISGAGPQSVKAAIEGDRSLGGAAEDCRVETADGYGAYEVSGVWYLGVEFTVRIYATGDIPS